jgi:hypothetical protein
LRMSYHVHHRRHRGPIPRRRTLARLAASRAPRWRP